MELVGCLGLSILQLRRKKRRARREWCEWDTQATGEKFRRSLRFYCCFNSLAGSRSNVRYISTAWPYNWTECCTCWITRTGDRIRKNILILTARDRVHEEPERPISSHPLLFSLLFSMLWIGKAERRKHYWIGRIQEFLSEGRKEWVPSPTGSIRQSPRWGLRQGKKPPNTKNMLKIWLNVTNSILFRPKNFLGVTISEGDMPPCPPPLRPCGWLT